MTPYTLHNILTRHAPERISQIEKKHIDVLILDEDPDLDLFSAEFPRNPGKTAHFEFSDLGGRECTAITYDNFEWSDNDRLV